MKTDDSTFEASAPGRLDVMGGIADYSGSLVLQLPIEQRTTVSIRLRTDNHCTIQSVTNTERLDVAVDFENYLEQGNVNYAFAKKQFKKNRADGWIAYVLGCALVLQKETQIQFAGADFVIRSEVPLGKGVSSSAALEVATMKALRGAFGLTFEGTELPVLAQRVENLIVGAPCGLMDQLTSYFGQPRMLLPILCQPDKIMKPVTIPPFISFMGIDSGIRHSVGGSSYADVRSAAFMGYTIIAQSLGVQQGDILEAIQKNDFSTLPFGGYLCNISVEEFDRKFSHLIPESMIGKDFLEQYAQTIDRVTSVMEATHYAVRQCTAHPIYEHARVSQFMNHILLMNDSEDEKSNRLALKKMGELMYQSHASYSGCGLGSERTDDIVSRAQTKFSDGIFGSKITGGGNGGTVCFLVAGQQGRAAVKELHSLLESNYSTKLVLFEV